LRRWRHASFRSLSSQNLMKRRKCSEDSPSASPSSVLDSQLPPHTYIGWLPRPSVRRFSTQVSEVVADIPVIVPWPLMVNYYCCWLSAGVHTVHIIIKHRCSWPVLCFLSKTASSVYLLNMALQIELSMRCNHNWWSVESVSDSWFQLISPINMVVVIKLHMTN
jgi:hypothetical protein